MARKASKILSPAEKKEQVAVAKNHVRDLRTDLKGLRTTVRDAKSKNKATAAVLRTAEREVAKQLKVIDKAVDAAVKLAA